LPSSKTKLSGGVEDVRVIGLGQACVDYLGRVSNFPEEDGKTELMDLHRQCGGPASTALVTLSRLGIPCSFIGSVSDDSFGTEIVQSLKEEGVNSTHLRVLPGHSSQFAFIAVTRQSGKRTIFWHRGTVPHLRKDEVDLSVYLKAEFLHLDGLMVEASLEAVEQARGMGLTVVLDAGTMRDGSLELASRVDVLIASARFADPLVGRGARPEKALEALRRLGPKTVIVTLGSEGSMGWKGDNMVVQKAFPVQAVDTTGAGDVYHGGYIYGLTQGWPMPVCMRFASAVAALKCREIGARKGIPALDEVQAFLDSFRK
jgi:sulfofructose kinase